MDDIKKETYKQKLVKEKKYLEEKIKEHSNPTDFGDDVDGFDEEKNEAEELENDLSIARDLKKRVNEIQDALDRLENNKFGICIQCQKEIGEELLEIDPAKPLCLTCQK
jgi:RNA polymerase-binding transcription factor DksA